MLSKELPSMTTVYSMKIQQRLFFFTTFEQIHFKKEKLLGKTRLTEVSNLRMTVEYTRSVRETQGLDQGFSIKIQKRARWRECPRVKVQNLITSDLHYHSVLYTAACIEEA